MKGAIDSHVHPAPDPYTVRPLDEIQVGLQACEAAMGGVVYKNAYSPTARSAYVTQKVVDSLPPITRISYDQPPATPAK